MSDTEEIRRGLLYIRELDALCLRQGDSVEEVHAYCLTKLRDGKPSSVSRQRFCTILFHKS